GPGGEEAREKTEKAGASIRVGVLGHAPRNTIVGAMQRAGESGVNLELLTDTSPDRVLDESDVVLYLPWPPPEELTPAIAAMASRRPLVIFESESSAGWPTLDPQTWQPRGFDTRET